MLFAGLSDLAVIIAAALIAVWANSLMIGAEALRGTLLLSLEMVLLGLLTLLLSLTAYGYEISKLDVYQDRFLVGRTQATLLLGDLVNGSLSEVPWSPDGGEKFYFENDTASAVGQAEGGGGGSFHWCEV